MKINVGIPGSTPIKRFDFDGSLPPTSIPRSSPGSIVPNKPSILNSAERRASNKRRQEHYKQMDQEEFERIQQNSLCSPEPSFGRPKTSRGTRNPNPDNFADCKLYCIILKQNI